MTDKGKQSHSGSLAQRTEAGGSELSMRSGRLQAALAQRRDSRFQKQPGGLPVILHFGDRILHGTSTSSINY